VAEAAADEIAPLRQHPDPDVRVYAVIARTVLEPIGPAEAGKLIALDDSDAWRSLAQLGSDKSMFIGRLRVLWVPSLVLAPEPESTFRHKAEFLLQQARPNQWFEWRREREITGDK
jgi:hypothetical protein